MVAGGGSIELWGTFAWASLGPVVVLENGRAPQERVSLERAAGECRTTIAVAKVPSTVAERSSIKSPSVVTGLVYIELTVTRQPALHIM